MFEMDIKRGSNELCLLITRGKVWKNTLEHTGTFICTYVSHIVRSGTKAFLRERVARGGGDSILDRLLETVHSTVLKQKIAPPLPPEKIRGGGGAGGTTCYDPP